MTSPNRGSSPLAPISTLQPLASSDQITAVALETTLLLLAFALPFESRYPILTVGPWFEVTNLELILGLTALAWGLHAAVTRRRPNLKTPLTIPILLFLTLAIVSALAAPSHRGEALKFATRLLSGAYAFFLIVATVTTRERFGRLIAAILVAALLAAVLGLVEAQSGGMAPLLGLFKAGPTRVGGQLRVSASFQYATIASMYFEMATPLLLGAVMVAQRRALRLVLPVGVAMTIWVVILTLTRAGLVALTGTFLVMASMAWLKRPLRRVLAPIGAAFSLMVLLVALLAARNSTFVTRLQTENEAHWYGVSYRAPAQLAASADEVVTVPVQVQNTGAAAWQASGDHAFVLSYQWLSADGTRELKYPRVETVLPRDLAPGESVELAATVRVVPQPGTYLLAWGMLQRGILWFKDRGIAPAYTMVEATPARLPSQPAAIPVVPRDETVYVKPPVGRLELWRAAVEMVARHPLLGVGPDNFRHVFGEYAGQSEWDQRVHANNLYLEMFADLGLLGGVAFLLILAVTARLLLRAWRTAPAHRFAPWSLALAGSLAAFLVHGLLDYFLEFVALYLFFWILLGLVVSFPRWNQAPTGSPLPLPDEQN
ncbi:MAG: O-antigen ligase family protein [Ardenticatenaceae bacterium]|nr:O-antigen ligase family protein [Ardenticatenaceae bacterium]